MPATPHTPGAWVREGGGGGGLSIREYAAQRGHVFETPIYDIQTVFYDGM